MAQAFTLSNGGNGLSSDDCTATADYVVKGKTYIGADTDDDINTGTLELTGNSTPEHTLSDRTFYSTNPLNKLTGTMPNHGGINFNLNCGNRYTIPAGYHNGTGTIISNNLASQSQGTAEAPHILTGQTAWVNGNKLTGTMPNRGAINQTLSINGTYIIPSGYHNGSGTIKQNIGTFGGQTITPSTSTQTISTSGKYGTGNIIINSIPSYYYNSNSSETVFNNGSFRGALSKGAYFAKYWYIKFNDDGNILYDPIVYNTNIPVCIENGCIVLGKRAQEILNLSQNGWNVEGKTDILGSTHKNSVSSGEMMFKQYIKKALYSRIEFDVYFSKEQKINSSSSYGCYTLSQKSYTGGNWTTFYPGTHTDVRTYSCKVEESGIWGYHDWMSAGFDAPYADITTYIKAVRLIK